MLFQKRLLLCFHHPTCLCRGIIVPMSISFIRLATPPSAALSVSCQLSCFSLLSPSSSLLLSSRILACDYQFKLQNGHIVHQVQSSVCYFYFIAAVHMCRVVAMFLPAIMCIHVRALIAISYGYSYLYCCQKEDNQPGFAVQQRFSDFFI